MNRAVLIFSVHEIFTFIIYDHALDAHFIDEIRGHEISGESCGE